MNTMWFAISEAGMDPVSRLTNTLLAGGRGRSGVEVGPDQIRVQMGGFKLTVPRASIRSASRSQEYVAVVSAVRLRRVSPSSEVAEAETVAVEPGPSLGSASGKGI